MSSALSESQPPVCSAGKARGWSATAAALLRAVLGQPPPGAGMGSGPALPGHKLTVTLLGQGAGWEHGSQIETEKGQMIFQELKSEQRKRKGAERGRGKLS